MINDIKHLIKDAKFGDGGKSYTVIIGLTEASAAAVYTFKTWPELQTKQANTSVSSFVIA
jgi:hypothetical protein